MNSAIFCLIFLASLTSQGCLATFKSSNAFKQSAEDIRNEELIKIRTYTNGLKDKSVYLMEKLLEILTNATRDVTEELMTNLTKIEADSKARMNQNSESTSNYFELLINSVKDKYLKKLIDQAERLNGSLEAKAASLRESIDQKILEMNTNLRIAVQEAYESEANVYWRKIEETQMAKIISAARRGVKAQVSAFMTQQFTDNLQNYEAQLKRLQQSYVDETRSKIGDLEAKKNLFAQELKDLAASLKLSLEGSVLESSGVVNNPSGHEVVHNGAGDNANSNPIGPKVVANGAGSGVVNNPAGHEVVHNGDGHDTDANGAGHEIDASTVTPKPSLSNNVFEADIDNSTPETAPTTSTPPIIKTSTELNPSDQIRSFFDKFRNKF
ncbi:uncharacterized protein LOC141534941 [Cotesia typhae]|uniref:uncharacterized protein LOC141534941 n=1 Tax=Cotesia typhae TaxID=2053667 RepID=UPI003D683801